MGVKCHKRKKFPTDLMMNYKNLMYINAVDFMFKLKLNINIIHRLKHDFIN